MSMQDYIDNLRRKSLDLVEQSTPQNDEDKKCVVEIEVGTTGSISAMVYSQKGIASAELCYNDDTSKRPGLYGLRLSFPNLKRVMLNYSAATNIPVEQIRTNDNDFIEWFKDQLEQKLPGVSWYCGEFSTYDSKTEALKALWSGEIFAHYPNILKQNPDHEDFIPE